MEGFADGTEITPDVLRAQGIIKGKADVKILGVIQLKHKFVVKAHAFSRPARQKIEETVGKCVLLDAKRE